MSRQRIRHSTAATLLIQEHHRKLGTDRPWRTKQVMNLCAMLKVTPYELGALVCIPFANMRYMLKADTFPPHIALHFRMIREWYMARKIGARSVPLVPVDYVVIGREAA